MSLTRRQPVAAKPDDGEYDVPATYFADPEPADMRVSDTDDALAPSAVELVMSNTAVWLVLPL